MNARRGFTLLELLVAMAIFSVLGAAVVYMMRQGLGIFTAGTRDQQLQDRQESVLPQVRRDFEGLYVGDDFDPPPPVPEDVPAGYDPPPRVPVAIRLRAGPLPVVGGLEGEMKSIPCPYFAFVVANASEWSDAVLRRAGGSADPTQARIYSPAEESAEGAGASFRPTGGLMELCYVAIPDDPTFPGLYTLYRGWRGAVGGPGTLLEPESLNSLDAIRKACRPVQRGVIHFGATWRRVWSKDFELDVTPRPGETEGYVGPVWDSTRGRDKTFALYKGPESVYDPSDDVFPRWVRLEITLVAPSAFGFGRGETRLVDPIGDKDLRVRLSDVNPILGAGAEERWLKVGTEWMRTLVTRVDVDKGEVLVERGVRGTRAGPHSAGDWVYVGQAATIEIELPVWRDRFARKEDLLK
jgi:prepilin-type N-terminal cleavage/methylation domain-containing protein